VIWNPPRVTEYPDPLCAVRSRNALSRLERCQIQIQQCEEALGSDHGKRYLRPFSASKLSRRYMSRSSAFFTMLLLGLLLRRSIGHGEADSEWTSTTTETSIGVSESPSFAPRGPPTAYTKFRRKLPSALKLDIPPAKSAVARFHDTCSVWSNRLLGPAAC
jgi:hypothetical protein